VEPSVLAVDFRLTARKPLATQLRGCGLSVVECAGWEELRRRIEHADAVCLGELGPREISSLEALRRIRATGVRIPIVMWLGQRTTDMLLEALRAGATDFLTQADTLSDVVSAVASAARGPHGSQAVPARHDLSRIVGGSAAMDNLRCQVPRLAASDCNVLITGETGAGKDLVAELIHRHSRRSRSQLVCVNCAALPDSLLEGELFGYDRGAFTGASAPHAGKLEYANRGTVFLDEIGEMSPHAQSKVLRVIENREVQRLGSNVSIPIDVRIIAATNQNLPAMMTAGTFRSDLYFRLNVARLHLPPLREHKQDISAMLAYFVEILNRRTGSSVTGWSEDALQRLFDHDWPGNIRELRNLVEAVFINSPAGVVGARDLPEWFAPNHLPHAAQKGGDRELLIGALSSTRWNKSKAAAELKWSRMTLYRKMRKYGIADQSAPSRIMFQSSQ